ncbi:MAG: helix-turn-helix domain-containing protein [Planctomycetota bacterium]
MTPPELGEAERSAVGVPSPRRVWVADRSHAVATALGGVLGEKGWVRGAYSDASGLKTALDGTPKDRQPSLLLLDLHLPHVGGAGTGPEQGSRPPRSMRDEPTGFELLPMLRLEHPGLAVVLLVEFARLETAVKAVRLGAADVLVKPVPDDRLVAAAEVAVSRQALMGSAGDHAELVEPNHDAEPEVPHRAAETASTRLNGGGEAVVKLSEAMATAERDVIRRALDAHGWARTTTAEALGINRATLYKKMRTHGLDRPGADWPAPAG